MLLHRFTRWITDIVSRVASRVREAFRTDEEREPVTSLYSRSVSEPYPGASYLMPPPPNWLEDGRRLRPSLLVPPPPRRPQPKGTPDASEKTGKQRQTRQSRSGGMNGLGGQASRVGATPPQEPLRSTPPSQPARALPASPAGSDDQQGGSDEQLLHRRLMSLRHLVRLGVYNEGFIPERTPEQYHYSLGLDDPAGPFGLGETGED